MNSPDYEKLISLEKPFRMQKLNLVWEKAVKKLPAEKLKLFFTDLKFQDKEELNLKKKKSEGFDKEGLKEGLVLSSFKAILEKYNLQNEFKALQDAALLSSPQPEVSKDAYVKSVFKDKKLNKLWLKAEQLGFPEDQLKTLKEEFQHHQNKIDQYYQMINQLHTKDSDDIHGNVVEHVLQSEVGDKLWKSDNPHQVIKEKHTELKAGYEYLHSRIWPDIKSAEFDEPQVNSLWNMAKNASFSPEELENLKSELHHFEHRVKKLKTLASLEMEHHDDNNVDDSVAKRNKRLKEYSYKVEKIQKDITSRILQRHSEL
ncbi:alpha-2-macroglobulin receptor-associated protein [Caerostris extrusa]|uniref:Alpha-2-macroglobulin receptor-associated protein n=1 Tax=Caerostris extrusa TaxID=172846 RepID=A0AAV4XNK5_CAEEX|nr:alpha-2-macroglobulin receptor-associated protein [Caerostris extrusa]